MSSPFDLLDDNDDDSSDLDFFFLCHLTKEAEEKEHSSKRQRRRCKRQLQSSERRRQRRHKWHHERISWQSHVEKLNHEIAFEKTYRMSHRAFKKLTSMLEIQIAGNYSKCGTSEPIIPEIVVAIGLRWLAGGSYIDIRHADGCSIASLYRCRDLFIDAVLNCGELEIVFPKEKEEFIKLASSFECKSSEGMMRGCVGAIDGFLATINRPTIVESGNNPGSFFSGHYMTYGINVQAVCDADSRFIYFGVIAPGKCSDQVAFERTSIFDRVAAFNTGFYLVGDAAYTLSDVMLVPFVGSQRDDPTQDTFNFFLSQLRIRIEMAFGLLQTKWCVLKKNLSTSLETSARILDSCARLHNYVINEKIIDNEIMDDNQILTEIIPVSLSPLGWGYLPTVEPLCILPGSSVMRDVILTRLQTLGVQRPPVNIERRRKELHEINLM